MGVDGFLVMTLPISPSLFFITQLFVKRHIAVKNDEKDYPAGRTIFITFPGEFLDKNSIKSILSQFVTVESIDLTLKHQKKGFINKTNTLCHVVVSTESQLERIMSMCTKPFLEPVNILPLQDPLNFSHISAEDIRIAYKNNYENPGKISKKVDEYMAKYDIMKEIERKAAKRALVDDEGFVKVVTGAKLKKSTHSMKKFDDFYKFQKRQTSQNTNE